MTIVINDPEIEAMLRRMAAERGLTPEALVAELARHGEKPDQAFQVWLQAFWERFNRPPPEPSEPLPKTFFDGLSE